VFGHLKSKRINETEWGRNLQQFISQVRACGSGEVHSFTPPQVFLKAKPGKKGVYRLMVCYENILDRVLLAVTAKYLCDCLDEDLVPGVYSFRRRAHRTHHTAVEDLDAYREEHGGQGLYVADCDLRTFFDCVPHEEVRLALRYATRQAKIRGEAVDPRVLQITEQYLQSYSFHGTALPAAEKILADQRMEGRIDQLSDTELRDLGHSPGDEMHLGIPQGGALSPLLANLVLSQVDRAVLKAPYKQPLFYARFCDDILIAHPSRECCQQALDTCVKVMAGMKIPPHKPINIPRYDRAYYAMKSKSPYRWSMPDGDKRTVPWVAFVGYQVRYDGQIRIRNPSIKNELHKQTATVGDVMQLLTSEATLFHLTGEEILRRTRARMTTRAIGRKDLRGAEFVAQPCWGDAFVLLEENDYTRSQLRGLDRNMERQLRRLKRRLLQLGMLETPAIAEKTRGTKFYHGAPYSYYGYFCKSQKEPVRFRPNTGGGYGG
jgi:hypothetical protein